MTPLTGEAAVAARTWPIEIPGLRPAFDNDLMGNWKRAHRMKDRDRKAVAKAAALAGVPLVGPTLADRKAHAHLGIDLPEYTPIRRRVEIAVAGPFRKLPDPKAAHKSILDACKNAGLLVDDDAAWCESPDGVFTRAKTYATTITITDLEG